MSLYFHECHVKFKSSKAEWLQNHFLFVYNIGRPYRCDYDETDDQIVWFSGLIQTGK